MKSTGLFANPGYFGYENHELLEGDKVKFKKSGEILEVRWWKQRGCWAGYDRKNNKMIMLYKILRAISKI